MTRAGDIAGGEAWPWGAGRSLRLGLALGLLLAVSGCMALDGDACVDPASAGSQVTLNTRDVNPRNCDGTFASARHQRSVLYGGDDRPRLWTGEAPRVANDYDVSRVNAPPGGNRPGAAAAYMGTLRLEYDAAAPDVAEDLVALRNASGRRFDPEQRVTVDFRRASLDFVLKQMLGGALGLNYVAPDDLGGSITFRTEEPLPKAQVLQVVRDLLARNGLELRNINGVYHVGRPELINSMDGTGRAGRESDRVSRVVRLRRGGARELIAVAKQVLPPGIELMPTNSRDTVILRADPGEADQAESLVKRLADSGVGEDRVAVIPLRQSPPDRIAGQLNEFYRARGIEGVSVMPLAGQHAVLVSARDEAIVNGAKPLVEGMDSEVRDEVGLRVVPIKHLNAEELAQRLTLTFGTGGGAQGPGPAAEFRPAAASGLVEFRDPAPLSRADGPGGLGRSSIEGPGLGPRSGLSGGFNGGLDGPGGFANGGPGYPPPGAGIARGAGGPGGGGGSGGPNQTRIIAEKSSNSLLVNAPYSLFLKIQEVVRVLDIPPAQVVIEATVLEVELTDRLQQGVQVFLRGRGITAGSGSTAELASGGTPAGTGTAGSFFNNSSTGTGTSIGSGSSIANDTGGVIGVSAGVGNGLRVDAVLRALQAVTKVKVISSPYLTVLNNKQARLVIGDQIPYSSRSQTANNLGNTTVTQEIIIKDTGIILDVVPQIHANNAVALKVSQSVSTPSESVREGNLTPVIATRTVESDILLQSGRTVLLAGLIQDRLDQQEGGVPVLRTVPVLGDLFKTKTDGVRRVELVLMLTPRVVRNAGQMEDLARVLQSQVHVR